MFSSSGALGSIATLSCTWNLTYAWTPGMNTTNIIVMRRYHTQTNIPAEGGTKLNNGVLVRWRAFSCTSGLLPLTVFLYAVNTASFEPNISRSLGSDAGCTSNSSKMQSTMKSRRRVYWVCKPWSHRIKSLKPQCLESSCATMDFTRREW